MGLFCRSITFLTITCDLCRTTEHRAHEARQEGDMSEFLRANEEKAQASLPRGWIITRGARKGTDAPRYVCPACSGEIQKRANDLA